MPNLPCELGWAKSCPEAVTSRNACSTCLNLNTTEVHKRKKPGEERKVVKKSPSEDLFSFPLVPSQNKMALKGLADKHTTKSPVAP